MIVNDASSAVLFSYYDSTASTPAEVINDLLVNVTGITGALNAQDFVFLS
jgi:hypothetical protein